MAWSMNKIEEFEVNVPSGKSSDATFILKPTTSFNLGVIADIINKRAYSNTAVLEAMNFLNHLFACGTTAQTLTPIGRNLFTNDPRDITIGSRDDFVEFRQGLFQAVHFGGNLSLTLNIDVTTAVFWRSVMDAQSPTPVSVLALATFILGFKDGQQAQVRANMPRHLFTKLERALKGVKYCLDYGGGKFRGRNFTISQLGNVSARDHQFHLNDGRQTTTTVEKYIKNTYNITLVFPNAPLVKKGESGYIPMELCKIVPVYFLTPSLISRSLYYSFKDIPVL